jgi:hypothetical protein
MIRVFASALNADTLLRIQSQQYSDKIYLSDTVPAGQSKLGKAAVSNLGHFLCQYITGHFSTLKNDNVAGTIDDGVSHLRAQLSDGNGQKKLYSDYIPLDLLLSPGRVRDGAAGNAYQPDGVVGTATAGNSLFYPQEFEYLFAANGDILFDVKNDSDVDLSYGIVFHGIRVLSRAAVAGLR